MVLNQMMFAKDSDVKYFPRDSGCALQQEVASRDTLLQREEQYLLPAPGCIWKEQVGLHLVDSIN